MSRTDDLREDLERAERRLRELESTPPSRIVDEREVSQAMWRLRKRIVGLKRALEEAPVTAGETLHPLVRRRWEQP